MKKLFLLLTLIFTAFASSFAAPGAQNFTCTQPPCTEVTDCTNPNNTFVVTSGGGQGTYTCTYSDSPTNGNRNICPFIYNGGEYTKHSIVNCKFSSGAPINSGLIFLIVAGAGLGAFMIRKKQQSNLTA